MGFAASNRVGLHFAKEDQFGVTPANPVLKPIRMTGESINFNITNTVSEEIRSDRMSGTAVQTGAESSGDANFELSFGSFDPLIEAAFTSQYSPALPFITGLEIDSTLKTITATGVAEHTAEAIRKGMHFVVKDCANEVNNGVFKIEEVTIAAGTIELTVVAELVTESAPTAKLGFTQILKNGVEEPSFFIQKFLQDADVPTYINFNGMRLNAMSLNIAVGSILTGSFSFIGTSSEATEVQVAGATTEAIGTNEPMNAVSDVHDVLVDGMPSGCFNSMTFSLTNNVRGQDCVGHLGHVGIAFGTIEVTGDISLYFRNKYDYDKYVNAEYTSLSFRVEDGSKDFYIVTIPRMKYETGSIVAGGKDQDVMFEGTYRAEVDPDEKTLAIIERFDAATF